MTSTKAPAPPERDRSTWALYLLTGYFAYLETVLGPIIPFIRAEQHIGYTTASLHFAAFALGGVLMGLGGERIGRRLGRRASLWGGGTGMACGVVMLVAGGGTVATVAGTFVMGLFGALLLIFIQACLSDGHPGNRAVVLLESNVAASAFAIGSALAVGASVRLGLGWRGGPALAIAGFVILGAVFWPAGFAHPRTEEPRRAGPTDLPPRFWLMAGVLWLGVGTEWCFGYWAADFLVDAGLDPGAAATSLSVFFAAMVCGRLIGSRAARRVGDLGLLLGALAVALFGFLVFWLSGVVAGHLVGLFMAGLGIASVYPVAVSAATSFAAPHTAAAAARLATTAGSAVLLAPLTLGALADAVGIEGAFALVIPFLLLSLALTYAAGRAGRARMAPSL